MTIIAYMVETIDGRYSHLTVENIKEVRALAISQENDLFEIDAAKPLPNAVDDGDQITTFDDVLLDGCVRDFEEISGDWFVVERDAIPSCFVKMIDHMYHTYGF